ncbi:MAG TPA: alpha/beta fold hydrolase [Gemmatimonadaceae bacterium]|nr:alpha/beta fold hydrolase [Gemmatimonadaceae bacterium]
MKTGLKAHRTVVLAAWLAAGTLATTIPGGGVAGAQDVSERGAFILRVKNDTVVIERFTRNGDSLQGSVSAQRTPRTDYIAMLGPGNIVRALSLTLFAANAKADDAPMQRAEATMRGDSALVEVNGGIQRIGTKAGAIPGLNNAFALFELFTRRARAAGGTAEVPYFALSGGVTIPVSLKAVGKDTIVVAIAGQEERLRVDATGRILGGSIPAQQAEIIRVSEAAAAALKLGSPDYSPPADAPYTAQEVTLKGPGGITLGGTLTVPKNAMGPVPAIVTITGSGQQDRDEYIPVAGGYRPFRQIADTLGRRGIAVLRLDDRMIGASGGAIGTSADYADDIRAGLAWLRTRRDIDGTRLGLVGHSEGGLIGPLVASTDPSLKGIVVLAGPAYTGNDIIHFQLRNQVNHDTSIEPAKKDSAYRAVLTTFDSTAQRSVWTRFFLAYDPIPTAKKVKVPTLILQGQTDQQVTFEQAEKLGAAIRSGGNRSVTVRVFPELNHLFIHDPDGNPAGYTRLPTNKMSSEVLGAIADWLAVALSANAPNRTTVP